MEVLPDNFDLIVVGTGMPECIIAAAAARIGKKVLHLDRNNYYGNDWASFSYDKFMDFIEDSKKCEVENVQNTTEANNTDLLSEGENVVICPSLPNSITNMSFKSYVRECPEIYKNVEENTIDKINDTNVASFVDESSEKASLQDQCSKVDEGNSSSSNSSAPGEMKISQPWTLKSFFDNRRKFNIDLAPKLLFARGSLVELLISSNIARYAEFQCISRVLTYINDHVEHVPCSRADVFSTKNVSVVEKRMLMKFLTFCLKFEEETNEIKDFEDKPFIDFLRSKKLTSNVEHYVIHAIAMVDEKCLTFEGLQATKKFLESLGRYGKTPFLCTCYGSAELPQCFCRLCAVYEGMYYLKRQADSIVIKDNKCSGIISMNQRISCEYLVMESGYAPSTFYSASTIGRISRAILITDASICPSERKESTILRFPPDEGLENPITLIELSSKNYVCPEDLNLVYLYCLSCKETSEDDLKPVVEQLFDEYNFELETSKPNILWSVYFNQKNTSCTDLNAMTPEGVYLTSSPDTELDYEHAVKEAQNIFSAMYPGEEFLPRAPDPEDILIESGNPGDDAEASKIENDVLKDNICEAVGNENCTPMEDIEHASECPTHSSATDISH